MDELILYLDPMLAVTQPNRYIIDFDTNIHPTAHISTGASYEAYCIN